MAARRRRYFTRAFMYASLFAVAARWSPASRRRGSCRPTTSHGTNRFLRSADDKRPLIHPVARAARARARLQRRRIRRVRRVHPRVLTRGRSVRVGRICSPCTPSCRSSAVFGARWPEQLGPRRRRHDRVEQHPDLVVDPRPRPAPPVALGGGRRYGSRRRVQLSVADGTDDQPGERSRPGDGDQFVHDVLRGRQCDRRSRDRCVRPDGRQAVRLPRRRRLLCDRDLGAADQTRSRRLARRRTDPRADPAVEYIPVAGD